MPRISIVLFGFFVLGIISSCMQGTRCHVAEKTSAPTLSLDLKKNIRLHSLYEVPRPNPLGPGIPLGVAEGVDSEKIRESTVRVIYGDESSRVVSSGFFVADNKVTTNIHVVAAADLASLHVRSGDTDCAIRGVTAFDPKNDLVILEVFAKGVPLVLGDSDAVRRGDTVFSVGYPVDRYNVMKNTVGDMRRDNTWFQMTVDIPPGSSGGPVLSSKGEVIGINVAGRGLYGYAIASNALKVLLTQSGSKESLEQWQERDPIRAYAYLVQSSREFHVGAYASAMNALDKVIALNPVYNGADMVYNNRGYVKILLGNSEFENGDVEEAQRYYYAAIEDFDKAMSLHPENISPYVDNRGYAKTCLGNSEFENGDVEEAQRYYYAAIEDFDKVVDFNPKSPAYADRGVAKVSLSLSKAKQGYPEEAQQYCSAAVEDFDSAINLNREDAYAYIVRSYAKICLGDFESHGGNMKEARKLYEAAMTDSDSAIQLESKNSYFYHTRGVAKVLLDDYNGAIDDFDKTVNLKSNFARAYYNRALLKEVLGQRNTARVDFEKAEELDPNLGR